MCGHCMSCLQHGKVPTKNSRKCVHGKGDLSKRDHVISAKNKKQREYVNQRCYGGRGEEGRAELGNTVKRVNMLLSLKLEGITKE